MQYPNAPGNGRPQLTAQPQQRVRPLWVEQMRTFYNGRISRQFVLHFNINDYAFDMTERLELGDGTYARKGDAVGMGDQSTTMREYLHQFLFESLGCQAIYTYSLAGGLTASDHPGQTGVDPLSNELNSSILNSINRGLKSIGVGSRQQRGQPQEGREVNNLPEGLAENFKLLGHILREQHDDHTGTNQERPIAVVLDYVEKLIPFHLDDGQGDREQLQALEVVQRWALDPLIRKTNNLVILLTANIGQIPLSVYAGGSGCRAIRVPFPDLDEREAYIRYKMTRAGARLVHLDPSFGPTPQDQAHTLARATQGMRLTDIDNLSRRVFVEELNRNVPSGSEMMHDDDVQREKAAVIDAQSAQLLEIVRPSGNFSDIGGLEGLKKYLLARTELMKHGESSPLIPNGLLLAGPPGTGKTIICEALASESSFNMVKMRGIRDKWVGSSERNLDLVLNLLKDLYPVVVFIDEIDQAIGQRDTGQSGDSGVGARMFARILQEMSDPHNRGRILWVAATNRADIIDEALKRRFDRVVPLLAPDVDESCHIFVSMMQRVIKLSEDTIQASYGGDLTLDPGSDPQTQKRNATKFRKVAEKTVERGLTGSGIEVIVRRAVEIAYEELAARMPNQRQPVTAIVELRHLEKAIEDYKPNHDRSEYDYQSLLAIRACNFNSVIPSLPKSGVYGRIQKNNGQIDEEKLEAEIEAMERARGQRHFFRS